MKDLYKSLAELKVDAFKEKVQDIYKFQGTCELTFPGTAPRLIYKQQDSSWVKQK